MYMLNQSQLLEVTGASGNQSCYEAYQSVAEYNSFSSGFQMIFFSLIFTPLWTIGYLMGQQSAVTAICGGETEYNQAKAAYCHLYPNHNDCKHGKK